MHDDRRPSYDLDHLSKESWQLELLASGIILLLLFSADPFIEDLQAWADAHMTNEFIPIVVVLMIVMATPYVSQVFFIAHIIIRGLWIGAVGLRSVSGDISLSHLRFHKKYNQYLRKYDHGFDRYIEQLERLASVLFSFNFLMIFYLMSAFLTFAWILLFGLLATKVHKAFGIVALLLLIGGLLVFIDFITLNRLKRGKVGYLFYPVFKVMNLLNLSILYRPLHYNFIDHPYTRRLLKLVYLLIIVTMVVLNIVDPGPENWLLVAESKEDVVIGKSRYEDRADEPPRGIVTLGSFYNRDYLEVTIPFQADASFEGAFDKVCPEIAGQTNPFIQTSSSGTSLRIGDFSNLNTPPMDTILSCYKQIIHLKIDGQRLEEFDAFFFKGDDLDDVPSAIRGILPMNNLDVGRHLLEVHLVVPDEDGEDDVFDSVAIPFYKVE